MGSEQDEQTGNTDTESKPSLLSNAFTALKRIRKTNAKCQTAIPKLNGTGWTSHMLLSASYRTGRWLNTVWLSLHLQHLKKRYLSGDMKTCRIS